MHFLLHEHAWNRVRERAGFIAPEVTPCVMCKDGRLLIAEQEVSRDEIEPDLAWLSMDLMYHGQVPEFVGIVTKSKKLKWVQTANAGLDNPIYREIAKTGTRLCNSNAQATPIAEYVLAEVLHHFQGIDERRAAQRNSKWRYQRFREVSGSKWLIIGFGNIGARIAARARAFEAEIIGVRHSRKAHALADKIIGQGDVLAELPDADVVVLACPITPETTGMVDAEFLGAMKEGSVLVNIARGALIDDKALIDGLGRGRPAHAVLDAFVTEPLPADHPYWTHPHVALSAHSSNAGSGIFKRGDELFLENLSRFLRGEVLRNEVDTQALL